MVESFKKNGGKNTIMNIYHSMNQMLTYIENQLTSEINYEELAHFLGTNSFTMQRLFSLLCDISLADYIRKRRLSNAGVDLWQTKSKVMEIATKYQYENATSFSRAFEKFHGIKPSEVRKNPKSLTIYPKLLFEEKQETHRNITYTIQEKEEFTLYGTKMKTHESTAKNDIPLFHQKMNKVYGIKDTKYGMTIYEDRFQSQELEYWILLSEPQKGLKPYTVPKSKWLVFSISSRQAKDIQKTIEEFYVHFFPSCQYQIRNLPELEYYHGSQTEFMVPIEENE